MRHLWSLLSGLAVTAAVLAAFAVDLANESHWWVLGRLIVAGLLLGLIATLRISPVGPVVAGLILLTPVMLAFTWNEGYADLFMRPDFITVGGVRAGAIVLASADGILGVAGAMMIVAAISGQRWRAWPKPVDALVDNGPVGGPWSRPLDDTVPNPVGANDGTTEPLWVQPR